MSWYIVLKKIKLKLEYNHGFDRLIKSRSTSRVGVVGFDGSAVDLLIIL